MREAHERNYMAVDPYLLTGADTATLDEYRDRGGGAGLEKARGIGPTAVIDEVERSGLRGRGGAGFPTGRKWRSVAAGGESVGDRFVVVNGAEGEPGCFKDRALLRENPYQVLEGALIAAVAVGARAIFVAIKSSFEVEGSRVEQAASDMLDAGWGGDISISIVRGPEEYLFGEEKALLEVVEGEDPLPRIVPPYLYGLFTTAPQLGWSAGEDLSSSGPARESSNPTVVNNVETLANVPHILRNGSGWHRDLGTEDSPGHVLVTVSGDTVTAGVGELEMGTPLSEAVWQVGGGMPEGRAVKSVLSGVANRVVTGEMIATPLSYEAMTEAGSGLGAAGFIVFDDTRNMVEVAYWVSAFLYVESCGQCPACKFGTGEVSGYLHRILANRGSTHDLELIEARLRTVDDGARCGLASQERTVVGSLLDAFPADVDEAFEGGVVVGQEPLVSKITDIRGGRAVLDERQAYKRPDWTYSDAPVVISRA